RRAARGEAGARDRRADPRAHQGAAPSPGERAPCAALRGDPEAPPLGQRRRVRAAPARARAAPRVAAVARYRARGPAHGPVRHGGVARHRRAPRRRQARVARVPAGRPPLGPGAEEPGEIRGARPADDSRAALRDARGAGRAARVARHPAALRRDHEGAVAPAATVPAARGAAPLPAARAPEVPRRLRLLRAAGGLGRCAAGSREVVGTLPARESRRARAHARGRGGGAPEEAPPQAQQAQGPGGGAARGIRGGAGMTRAAIALGSNLDDPEAHVKRGFDDLAALPGTKLLARSKLYRTKPVGYADQPDFINACA